MVLRIARLLWMSNRPVKAYIFFKLIAENGRDLLTIDNIRSFYRSYLKELNPQDNNENHERTIDIFLHGLQIDEHANQELTVEQFYNNLQQHPQALESLYLISIPDQDTLDEHESSQLHQIWMYIRNNLCRLSFLLAYILTTVALFVYVIVFQIDDDKNHNGWKVTARISGELINFHFALAVTLMLKETCTIIRRIRWLRHFIPVDDHIDAHKIVGSMLFFWAILHTFAYAINYALNTTGEDQRKKVYFQTSEQIFAHIKVLFFSSSRTYMGGINVHHCGWSRLDSSVSSNNWQYSLSSSVDNDHFFTSMHSTATGLFSIVPLYPSNFLASVHIIDYSCKKFLEMDCGSDEFISPRETL